MSDYPDPDEEYELMYADDLELLRESEENLEPNVIKKKPLPAKRSLDFSSPVQQKTIKPPEEAIESLPLTPNLPAVDDVLPYTPLSSKRTADDLFGDIDDINFDEVELPSKRQKTEEENDLDMINRIIESRKLKQMLLEPSRVQSKEPVFSSKDNISLDIPRWPFIPVTNSNGDRFYVRLESEETWDKALSIPSEQLSLRTTYAKAWEEAQKFLEEKEQQHTQILEEPLPDVETESDINGNNLWVEKYRPKSYVDLLSEEPVNRALLHWLHLWDKIVFKKEVKTKEPQQRSTFSKRTGQFQLTNHWKGKKEAEPEVDEDGRPHHKVALLCGPPGVGKTTLAHLLAKLAGYRPVELNASDERSTEAFRTALQNATLMKSVLDRDRRPNCLILDEIDGAPLPTVELLVKWCTATTAEGKKKAKSQPLRRPVIAICNDLYATSLRPLRPVALVIQVGGVSLPRLSSRLSLVSQLEGLKTAPHVVSALATRCAGDVRSAILVLSFIKNRHTLQLNMEDVMNASIGTKDCNKTIMQALQAVFTVNDQDPSVIMKTIQAAGEYDRLIDGIFENYLSARVDSRLLIACETLSWLILYDVINSWTLRNQNYSLYGALPLCIARCHSLLASRTPQRVKFPTQAQEMYRKRLEMDSIVESVWRGSTPSVSLPKTALKLDLLPMLPYLLAPTLRSANVQLCSESERKTLRTCAGAMCDYGLQYAQQRTPDGLYAFVLEPDVFKIAFFGNEERVRPSPAVRQAIAREQQLEVIRRNEEMANRVSGNTQSSQSTTKTAGVKPAKDAEKEKPLPNHLQRLQPKEIEKSVPQVTSQQLKRLWMNMKQRQREAITKERQHRLATGGGPSTSDAIIDADIAEIAPALIVGIDGAIDSDTAAEITVLAEEEMQTETSPLPSTSSTVFPELTQTSLPVSTTISQTSILHSPCPTPLTTTSLPNPIVPNPLPSNPCLSTPRLLSATPRPATPSPATPCLATPRPSIPRPPSPTSTRSFQRQKNNILQSEYEDRRRRADELHELEMLLLKEKIREAKAKADLAVLLLEQQTRYAADNNPDNNNPDGNDA